MTSGPITSWEIDEKTMETLTVFIFLGFKITANDNFHHELKDACSLEEKPDNVFKDCVCKYLDSVFKAEILLCQQLSI